MTTPIVEVDTFTAQLLTIVDGDAANAATMLALLQPLANRSKNLKTLVDALRSWAARSFSAAVPFDAPNLYMPPQAVGGPIGFTPNTSGAVPGGACYVRLVANGTHTPTFTGLLEHGSSMGYDNTNGITNLVSFWYDGSDYWYSVAQAVNAVPVVNEVSFALTAFSNVALAAGVYSRTGGTGHSDTHAGNAAKSLPASIDGYVAIELITATTGVPMLYVDDALGNPSFATSVYGLYANGNWMVTLAGAGGLTANVAPTAVAIGDHVRVRRSGTTLYGEVSKDGGNTWITMDTRTGMGTSQLWPLIAWVGAGGQFRNLRGNGVT